MILPLDLLLGLEPESDLTLGRLRGVRAMAHVSPCHDAVISSDCPWVGVQRICGSQQLPAGYHCCLALPDHPHDWPRLHVLNQMWEEWLLCQILVVLSQQLLGRIDHLESSQMEAFLLEAGDNIAHESTLHTVWLHHDVCTFHVC